jgi:hypothetical protein
MSYLGWKTSAPPPPLILENYLLVLQWNRFLPPQQPPPPPPTEIAKMYLKQYFRTSPSSSSISRTDLTFCRLWGGYFTSTCWHF